MASPSPPFDPYTELGVERTATPQDITAAYRRLALRHHPDRNHGNEESATSAFQRLSKAYEILSDARRREDYDNPPPATAAHPFSSPFDYDRYADEDYFRFSFAFERDRARREAEIAARYEAFLMWLRKSELERSARAQAASRQREQEKEEKAAKEAAKEAAKQAKEAALAEALADKERRFRDEARVQEQRWLDADAITKEEKLAACLHSDNCSKINSKTKIKCGSCHSKRGTFAFECPHCAIHLCQLCLTNFSTRRQKLGSGAKTKASSCNMSTSDSSSSLEQNETTLESPAASVGGDYSGNPGEADDMGKAETKGKAENKGKAEESSPMQPSKKPKKKQQKSKGNKNKFGPLNAQTSA